MSQTVTVPGVGDLEFPDGMSQGDMAAAIQKNFPQIHAPRETVVGGIPTGSTSPAYVPPPEPTVGDKIKGGLHAGLNLAADTIDSFGGLLGHGAGLLGGLAAAVGVKLGGGVQPDDPRVLALTGDNRPRTSASGEVPQPIDAIDEAAAQGARSVVGALHSGPSIDTSGLGRDYANAIEEPLSRVDPQVAMTMGAPISAAAGSVAPAARMARAAAAPAGRAISKAGAAVGEAAGTVAGGAARAAIGVDPELIKTAEIATNQFPDIKVPPDRLAGAGTRKNVGEALATAPGGGGEAVASANKKAVTNYLVKIINPEETSGRMTPATLSKALDRSGSTIGRIEGTVDIPMADLQSAFTPVVEDAAAKGGMDTPRIVQAFADDLQTKVRPDGTVPGSAFREWASAVKQRMDSAGVNDPDLARRLGNLREAGRDVQEASIPDPAVRQELSDARRQYAIGSEIAEQRPMGLDGLVDPGKLESLITSSKLNKRFYNTGRGGGLADLARVGKLIAQPAGGGVGGKAAKALLAPVAQLHNRVGPKVTKMLTEREPAAPPAPPAPPPDLELAPPGAAPSTAAPPAPAGPLGDLTPDWETAPGAAPTSTRAAPIDATDLHPALGDNVVTTGNPAPPSAGQPGSQIPAVPGRPDLPDAMVSGRPGETAATDTANAAMHEPGAVAARASQEAAAKAAEEGVAAQKAAAEAAKPKPAPADQAKLDEIDKAIGETQSPIVRDTLQKARDQVMKDVAARDTLEKTKAAADELRATAAKITDPAIQKVMLQRADKLDPPPKPEPKAKPEKPAGTPLPPISYADTLEWRTTHGLGPEDAQRAVLTRKALDIDAKTVEAAAVQHNHNPRAFDRVVDDVIKKGAAHADEVKPAAQGSQESQTGAGQPAGAAEPPAKQRGPNGDAAAAADVAGHQPGGPAEAELEDPHAEAARLAKFHLDHPRAPDGTFTEKE